MKNVLFFVLAIVLLMSCESEKNVFEISGTIENSKEKTITLSRLKKGVLEVVDTSKIDKKGHFSIKTSIPQKDYYLIGFPQKHQYIELIIGPEDKLTLNSNGKDFVKNAQIKGSKETADVLALFLQLETTQEKLRKMGEELRNTEHQNAQVSDSLRQAFQEKAENLIEKHRTYSIDFIKKNKNSLSALTALIQPLSRREPLITTDKHFDLYLLLDSLLMQKYAYSSRVAMLHDFVSKEKSKQEAKGLTKIGAIAPDIALKSPEGKEIKLSSLRGKYVLLDFWASWCKPCLAENPNLVKAYKKYKDKGFEIYQVSLDRKKESWLKTIEKQKLNWIHVSDLKQWQSPTALVYNITGIPANFLLDPRGKIIAKNLRGNKLEIVLAQHVH